MLCRGAVGALARCGRTIGRVCACLLDISGGPVALGPALVDRSVINTRLQRDCALLSATGLGQRSLGGGGGGLAAAICWPHRTPAATAGTTGGLAPSGRRPEPSIPRAKVAGHDLATSAVVSRPLRPRPPAPDPRRER